MIIRSGKSPFRRKTDVLNRAMREGATYAAFFLRDVCGLSGSFGNYRKVCLFWAVCCPIAPLPSNRQGKLTRRIICATRYLCRSGDSGYEKTLSKRRGRIGRPVVRWHAFVCRRSEEHTSELQSLMRISYAVFCLKNKNKLTYYHSVMSNSTYTSTIFKYLYIY